MLLVDVIFPSGQEGKITNTQKILTELNKKRMANNTNDSDFTKDVLESDVPVLVDFWAEWCAPCKQLSPLIDELSGEYKGKVKIYKLNIEESPNIPTKYEVRGIPNLILFKDGQAVDNKVGSLPKQALKDWLDSHIA